MKTSPPTMATSPLGESEPALEPAEIDQEEIRSLAHSYWESRGRPDGSAEEDWFRAEQELRGGKRTQAASAGKS